MPENTKYQNRIELLQGTLDVLSLQTLQCEPMRGQAIARILRNRPADHQRSLQSVGAVGAVMEPEVQL